MPGRNVVKAYVENSYYHVYNRGVNRQDVFVDDEDYRYFEWLFERTLSSEAVKDSKGREFTWLQDAVDLNAYCLMSNHFHLLVYRRDIDGVSKLLRTLATAYTMYFNKRYRRRGPLFESSFKAVPVIRDEQLMHITRYIHLNHSQFNKWPHSSFSDYLAPHSQSWLMSEPILELFANKESYREFVLDHEEAQSALQQLKYELANSDY